LSDTLNFRLDFRSQLFDIEIINNLKNHFLYLLEYCINSQEFLIQNVQLLNKEEYKQIVYDWNKTEAPYPEDKTIQQLFEEQAERTPENIAVVYEDKQLTYRELNEKSNQLAHTIRHEYKEQWKEEVKGDTLIGIYIERSLEMMIGILGILKAGGAYVPFDSADPEERLKFKIADSGCRMVLTSSKSVDHLLFLTETDTLPLSIDGYWEDISRYPVANPKPINKSTDLAYVIYTSGSTGQPKGVMGSHTAMINRIYWMWEKYPYSDIELCCAKTSLSFVDAISEIFSPLLKGVAIVLISDFGIKDVLEINSIIESKGITRILLVPSLLNELIWQWKNGIPKKLRIIVSSGEPLSSNTTEKFFKLNSNCSLINLYGSSEVAADATCYEVEKHKKHILIGKPISNIKAYILDSNLQPVPVGIVGELYIGGDGLARGYLNRSELTSEGFISNPFRTEEEKAKGKNLRMYKTGDMVRWLPDGNIEYIGRNDFQIKIRGFRIETGEIENKLQNYPLIDQTVVTAYEKEGNKALAAYYTAKSIADEPQAIDKEDLRKYISSLLPDYMVPTYFIELKQMPLNTSGKIDRKLLPVPDMELITSGKYVPPRDEIEQTLHDIWAEVLGIEKIGIYDDFFHIGGNSLK